MIGTARRRRDGESKVRGATRYVGDMPVHGLLHARPVLAAEAHARITSIDGSDALAVPGVVAVLTAADLPLVGGSGRAAEPLAREEIVWSGQPGALVVAEAEAAAPAAAPPARPPSRWRARRSSGRASPSRSSSPSPRPPPRTAPRSSLSR